MLGREIIKISIFEINTKVVSIQNFDPLNDFLYGYLHMLSKARNVKICEHSSF